jgi:hypothetical protein
MAVLTAISNTRRGSGETLRRQKNELEFANRELELFGYSASDDAQLVGTAAWPKRLRAVTRAVTDSRRMTCLTPQRRTAMARRVTLSAPARVAVTDLTPIRSATSPARNGLTRGSECQLVFPCRVRPYGDAVARRRGGERKDSRATATGRP